jgi:hypothetical protein
VSVPAPAKDPRFRRYRAAAYGLYIALVSAFSLMLIVSVVRSIRAMTPPQLPPAEPTLSVRECLDGAQALWRELEREREALVNLSPARSVDQEWMVFRTGWLKQLRERESHCALESRERGQVKVVYRRLEQVLDLYTIHAVQYAGEVGGAVDGLHDAFEAARRSPAAGRLP